MKISEQFVVNGVSQSNFIINFGAIYVAAYGIIELTNNS